MQVLPAENSLTLANKYPRLVQMCEDLAGGWLPACCWSAQQFLLLPGLALTCELSLTLVGMAVLPVCSNMLHQQMDFCLVQVSPLGGGSGNGWHWEQLW